MSSDPTHNPSTPAPSIPYASSFTPHPNPPQTIRSGSLTPGTAFVTGGASGLGNAIARSFAREGAKGVVIVDIGDEAKLEAGKKRVNGIGGGVECIAIQADVTKEEDMERAVREAVAKFGRIDYAANFAGVIGPMAPVSELSAEDFQKCMAVNSTGVLISTKYELRQMMGQESLEVEVGRPPQQGAIVNCASINSQFSLPGTVPYTASKHAVVGITKAAALEARPHHIRVNAISPGFLETPMIQSLLSPSDPAHAFPRTSWETFEARQGRKAAFEEVGDVVAVLCSGRMSLVTGVNLFVDGGFSINEGNN